MKKCLLILAISTHVLMANNLTTDEMQTKAILKLIKQNELLEGRVAALEKKNAELEQEKSKISVSNIVQKEESIETISVPRLRRESAEHKIDSQKPLFYFTPKSVSSVRDSPSPKGKYVFSIRKQDKVSIYSINCKNKEEGYWGKSTQGWIYISNPKYGYLSNNQGEKLPQGYQHWCSEE